MQRPKDSSYIPTLDGWRAVAVLGVFICHGFPRNTIFTVGELGVTLFFGISGFLITNRMLREHEKTGRLSLKNFYLRRVFRILPAAFFYLAVVYLLGRLQVVPCTIKDVLTCVAFVRNYVHDGVNWYTAHFWSLSVEEHFYLMWPAIFLWVGRRRAMWVAPSLAVLAVLWRTVDRHYEFVSRLAHDPGLVSLNAQRSDYCCDALFWGCALALWLPSVRRVPALVGTPLCLLVGAVVIVTRHYGFFHNYAIAGIGVSVLIASTVLKPESWIGRLLEFTPVRFVGRMSYSLYLWQMLFLTWFDKRAWQHLPLNVIFAFACALVSYYVIEKPMVRLGHRMTRTVVPQEAVAA